MSIRSSNCLLEMYHKSVLVLLFVTALCKLVSVMGEARVLGVADPIFRIISTRQILMAAAIMELGVAWYLWSGSNSLYKSFYLLWLSAIFIAYRFGLWLIGYKGCSCLGTVTQWMPVAPATVDVLMKLILAYMTVGSAFFLIMELVCDKGKKPVENAHAD